MPTDGSVAEESSDLNKPMLTDMMKRVIAFVVAAVMALGVNAQLLWKIEGRGLKEPSYIVGTHHLAPFSVLDSIAGIREAMKNTAQVVGELNIAEMQTPENMMLMQSMITTPADSTMQAILPAEEYQLVRDAVSTYLGFDLAEMPNLKPAFISNNIIVMMYVKLIGGFKPQDQLDSFFQSFATDMGRRVVGLETAEFQFRLLYDGQTIKRQAEQLVCELRNRSKLLLDARQLTNIYMKQNLDEMLRLSEETRGDDCDMLPSEVEQMINARNRDWAEKLPAIIAEAPSLIAVGALHLPGENGVLNLLKKQGYRVTPL
jgi:uncharacterized protein YbaP (TraB family)